MGAVDAVGALRQVHSADRGPPPGNCCSIKTHPRQHQKESACQERAGVRALRAPPAAATGGTFCFLQDCSTVQKLSSAVHKYNITTTVRYLLRIRSRLSPSHSPLFQRHGRPGVITAKRKQNHHAARLNGPFPFQNSFPPPPTSPASVHRMYIHAAHNNCE